MHDEENAHSRRSFGLTLKRTVVIKCDGKREKSD